MNPYLLERLYDLLGKPRWFWPLVFFILFIVAPSLAGAIDGALQ